MPSMVVVVINESLDSAVERGPVFLWLVTGNDTNRQFSFHLVRIAPGKTIGNHIHETQLETHEVISGSGLCVNDGKEIEYEAGVISIMPAKIPHEVKAGDKGLYLFAKFMPALC